MTIEEREKTDTGAMSLGKQEGMEPGKRWGGGALIRTGRSPREVGGQAEVGASCGKV